MRTSFLLLAVLIISGNIFTMQSKIQKMEIKDNWHFQQKGSADWLPASVPGCVHTDLINNKIIDDPYFGINETKLQWIGEKDWVYKTQFDVPASVLEKKNVELIFKGLDTYADVYLNDSLILSADNMFREWKVDCRNILRAENSITIEFKNVFSMNVPKWINAPFRLLAGDNNDQSDTMIAMYSRKAQYHYGWDWGPRLVTYGIWRPIIIEAWDDLKIESAFVINKKVNKERAELSSVVEIESFADTDVSLSVSADNNVLAEKNVSLTKGLNKIDIDIVVDNPRLWWSNGLGEQNLYNFRFAVNGENSVDEKVITTGIRSLQLVREKDSVGVSFYVKLNGVPVFMKGANYIPQDNFQNRVTREKYETLIASAAEANMNMLRVWGGGIYEEDTFYEMCDKYGILIWQDFMFACAMYPGDDHFMESVRNEVIDNVKRLRNHPSIALYCGNNENQIGWYNWGWKSRYSPEHQQQYEIDMNRLFLEVIPNALREADTTRFYSFSSPSAGFQNISYNEGDIHYWGVWHAKEPFENYDKNIARFVSEYGFQSYPTINSINKFTLPEDRNLDSEVMLSHQRSMSDNRRDKRFGNRLIKAYMEKYYQEPKNFESYLYVSQLLQAEAMTMAIEAHRRNKPLCMGSLYWQINDCWPVASWSGIDYYGTWKAIHYAAKKAFDQVIIAPLINDDDVDLFIVSDILSDIDAVLQLKITDLKGEAVFAKDYPVHIDANSSKIYAKLNKDELGSKDPAEVVISAKLVEDNTILTEKIFYLEHPKDLKLEKPEISLTIIDDNSIEITSAKLAKNVYLSTDDGIQFSENFFDLLPGEKRIVHAKGEIQGKIRVISLIDSKE